MERTTLVLSIRLGVIELVAWGILYYVFSVYLPTMEIELAWSAATLSLGFSLALLVSAILAPAIGIWIDRHGSRGLMACSAMVGSVGLIAWSLANTVLLYLIGWVAIGAAMAGTLYAPAFATVVRANPETSRAAILLISVIGALASTAFLPLSSLLGSWLGWRGALRVFALLLAAVIIPIAMTLPRPTKRLTVTQIDKKTTECGPWLPSKLGAITAALMIADAVSAAFNVHLIVLLVSHGLTIQAAAAIAGVAGIAKITGRVATLVGHRFSARTLLSFSSMVMALVLLLPLISSSSSMSVIMVFVFGVTGGARTVLRPAIITEVSGTNHFGVHDGVIQMITSAAKAVGPVGLGLLISSIGITWAWSMLSALALLSGVLIVSPRSSS